jgi:hypothetical protein
VLALGLSDIAIQMSQNPKNTTKVTSKTQARDGKSGLFPFGAPNRNGSVYLVQEGTSSTHPPQKKRHAPKAKTYLNILNKKNGCNWTTQSQLAFLESPSVNQILYIMSHTFNVQIRIMILVARTTNT